MVQLCHRLHGSLQLLGVPFHAGPLWYGVKGVLGDREIGWLAGDTLEDRLEVVVVGLALGTIMTSSGQALSSGQLQRRVLHDAELYMAPCPNV